VKCEDLLSQKRSDIDHQVAKCYPFDIMPALVIKSFPEALHAKLRQMAAAHRRSVTQETIHLIEIALTVEETPDATTSSFWATRKLLPEYEALLKSGALNSDSDSTIGLSEERDAR
jgi:plasmid stability protein